MCRHSIAFVCLTPASSVGYFSLPALGRGPGLCTGPAYLGLGHKLHTQPILDRLGCVSQKRTFISKEGHCSTRYNSATTFRELKTYRRLYLFTKTRLNFFIKAHCSQSNAAAPKHDLFSASATRERGRGLAVAFHHGQGGDKSI